MSEELDNPKPDEDYPVSNNSDDGRGLRAHIHSVEITYSGPLPHPEILRRFEEILPGSAERIFAQFEKQSEHRRKMESEVIPSGAFSQRVGAVSAAAIGLLGVAGGLWLTHEGQSVAGLVALFGTLGGLVGTFLYQKNQQTSRLEERRSKVRRKR